MAELLKCVFCKCSDINLIMFTEEMLKKCQVILKHRKEHNLKFKDVVLPVDLFESGYHRQCFKPFTGLMEKYYLPKSKSIEKSIVNEKSPNITDPSTACSSTSELVMQSIEPESSNLQPSQVIDPIPDPNTIPEPTIIPKLIGLVPTTSQNISVQVENDDPHYRGRSYGS